MEEKKTACYGHHIYFDGPYIGDGERDIPQLLLLPKTALLKIRDAANATLKRYDEEGIGDGEVRLINNRAIKEWESKTKEKRKLDTRNLYLIHNTMQNTLKIGISADPNKRLRTLQTSTGDYLTLIFDIKGKAHLEKELHKEFEDIRLASEWFKYDKRIIERFNGLRYGRMD